MIKLKDILYEEGLIEGKLQRITNDWWTGEVTGKYDESTGFNMHKQVRMYNKEKTAMRVKKINWRISYIKQYWFSNESLYVHDLMEPNLEYGWSFYWARVSKDTGRVKWVVDDKIVDKHIATLDKHGNEWLKTANKWKSIAKKKDYEKYVPELEKKFKELNDASIKLFKFVESDIRKNKKPSPMVDFQNQPRYRWLHNGSADGYSGNEWGITMPNTEEKLTAMIGTHEQFAPTPVNDKNQHRVSGKYLAHRLKMMKKIAPKAVVALDIELIDTYRTKIYMLSVNWPRDPYTDERLGDGPPKIEYKRGPGFNGDVVYSVGGKKYSDWFKWTPAFDGSDYPKEATVSNKLVNDKFKELIKSLPLAVQNDPNFKKAIS